MESFVYFNIIVFAISTWYTFDDSDNRSSKILQTVAIYISVGSIFLLFLLVIVFHLYRYGSSKVYSLGKNTKIGKKMRVQMSHDLNENCWILSDSNLLDVIDRPRDSGGYIPPYLQLCQHPSTVYTKAYRVIGKRK